MAYTVVCEDVAARPIAAVRRRVRSRDVAATWRPALDQVWAFLRRHDGIWIDGHNTFVYHHAASAGEPMDVEFGVEVSGPFEGEGEVVFSHTPVGEVASTIHVGYDRLGDAHAAIDAWRAAHDRAFAGHSWEVYGDPGPDPDTIEIRVVYLLA